ncbi:hypothetical protein [Methylorubrum populi]|uniref:hypothetical protein n=1 Tax=Methylorubrum populi TaxID=223967 RepID=UPI0012FFB615|nr:hypothetical protein [Methylorubrum populi]
MRRFRPRIARSICLVRRRRRRSVLRRRPERANESRNDSVEICVRHSEHSGGFRASHQGKISPIRPVGAVSLHQRRDETKRIRRHGAKAGQAPPIRRMLVVHRSRTREEPGQFVEDVGSDRSETHRSDLAHRREVRRGGARQGRHICEAGLAEASPQRGRQEAASEAAESEAFDNRVGQVVEQRQLRRCRVEEGLRRRHGG